MMKEAWQKGDIFRVILLSLLMLIVAGAYALYVAYQATYKCYCKLTRKKEPSYGRFIDWG